MLIGRWLLTNPRILILDEPTRGIDVGAKAEIHRLVTELARNGVRVIMISSEMPEVLGMSDRIMVMHEGRVTGFLDRRKLPKSRSWSLRRDRAGRVRAALRPHSARTFGTDQGELRPQGGKKMNTNVAAQARLIPRPLGNGACRPSSTSFWC